MEVHERRSGLSPNDVADDLQLGLQLSNQDEPELHESAAKSQHEAEDESEATHRETLRTLRLAFVGNVNSGKSSLIGTLIKGDLDDGRGSSRQAIFRHKHEVESGRTSSVATAYLGFDARGQQILSKRAGKLIPWAELARMAHKRIQLIDLAGHEKYLKTTVFGLTGMQPDVVVVVVGANMGVKRMTKEHLAIAVALEIPIVVALTKIDIAPKNVAKETLATVRQSLRRYGKMAMLVKTPEQAVTAAKGIPSNRITPILPISNVTGDGLENLRRILFETSPSALFKAGLSASTLATTKSINQEESIAVAAPTAAGETKKKAIAVADVVEMPIDETYLVPGVGFILAGTLVTGSFKVNDALQIGPDYSGNFHKVTVRSMESMYMPLKELVPGQTAALAVRSVNKKFTLSRATFRKGMILLSPEIKVDDYVSRVFEARVVILHHQTTVTVGYQPMVNCRTIRQTAEIVSIESNQDVIRTGDRALVRFRFIHAPEFLKKGMRFVFRDGQAKGIGKVVRIIPAEQCETL
ncbi:GTP-binding protein 1 [Phytophthora fragariae]|uniref:Elongation factor Tu, chloroplastic n=1 Tax=Phytophthora fragariae TaxID=53985 RepID=A0A6G0RZM4_9STRA|nr:GTP-binding protein 1 [Phytophthora fragariae]